MPRTRPIQLAAGVALGALAVQQRRARQRAERFAAAALESLLRAIDANDPQTGAHVRRVAEYALILADAIGVDDDMRQTVELAALFHDIGKIHEALFDIVHEPRKLTPAERRAIATHPERGAEVLAPIAAFYPDLAEAVLAHHERWNGTGYPRGLAGERIPPAARIVSLADTFDAITHRRRYRDGRQAREALRIIAEGRGTQFDPQLTDLMLLPPIQGRLERALRKWARIGEKIPQRGNSDETEAGPQVSIRWRSKSKPPSRVREKMADAR
jgi:putative nucleotidyltransferase with HDIG domain